MKILTLAQFIARLLPDLIALARQLYTVCHGDVDAARAMIPIPRIRDHGADLDAGRAEIDRRVREAEREEKEGKGS